MENVKLKFLHVCENAFLSKDNKLNVVGIFNQINAKNFPAIHPKLSIVSNVSGSKGKYEEVIEIVSSSGEVIANVKNENMEILEDNGATNLIANFIMLTFPIEGKYRIRVKINDDIIDESNFILLSN